jgi:hypothetical protein
MVVIDAPENRVKHLAALMGVKDDGSGISLVVALLMHPAVVLFLLAAMMRR